MVKYCIGFGSLFIDEDQLTRFYQEVLLVLPDIPKFPYSSNICIKDVIKLRVRTRMSPLYKDSVTLNYLLELLDYMLAHEIELKFTFP